MANISVCVRPEWTAFMQFSSIYCRAIISQYTSLWVSGLKSDE